MTDPKRARKRKEHKRYYAKTAFKYEPRPWTAAEDHLVLLHAIPDSELSVAIGRSLKAICNRRWRLRQAKGNKSDEWGR